MSRYLRRYSPGSAFHITARLMGRAHLLTEPVRTDSMHVISQCMERTDARLLAFALMSNHLHMVVRQGQAPLSSTMQPILRRVAILVQKAHRTEGHVFERTYRDTECLTADHLRDAIVYTHLNPVRAGVCQHPDEYPWSSHHAYAARAHAYGMLESIAPARELFRQSGHAEEEHRATDYVDYVSYRLSCDEADAADRLRTRCQPDLATGNDYWMHEYASSESDGMTGTRLKRLDLRDIALRVMSAKAPGLPLDALRGSHIGSRQLQRIRREIIQDARGAGYSGAALARFFLLSSARVSELARGEGTLWKKSRDACVPE